MLSDGWRDASATFTSSAASCGWMSGMSCTSLPHIAIFFLLFLTNGRVEGSVDLAKQGKLCVTLKSDLLRVHTAVSIDACALLRRNLRLNAPKPEDYRSFIDEKEAAEAGGGAGGGGGGGEETLENPVFDAGEKVFLSQQKQGGSGGAVP
jgi:hypothetical protein